MNMTEVKLAGDFRSEDAVRLRFSLAIKKEFCQTNETFDMSCYGNKTFEKLINTEVFTLTN